MMSNVRDSSQQDRRVYVGNLSYDVKWHHLKDFMRQGWLFSPFFLYTTLVPSPLCFSYVVDKAKWFQQLITYMPVNH